MQLLEDGRRIGEPFWLLDDGGRPTLLGKTGFSGALSSWPGRIKDFKSDLRVVEGETVVAEKTIEVNYPLSYKGYNFYQASYDQKNEKWSGIEVAKDPGVVLVYAGFVLLIIGLVFIFYVQPALKHVDGGNRQ